MSFGGGAGGGGARRPFTFASLVPAAFTRGGGGGGGRFTRTGSWRPGTFAPPIIFGTVAVMYGLAIGLEIALAFSTRYKGYPLAPEAGYSFGNVQFLKSFLPTLVTTLLVLLWSKQYEWLRLLQPFVTLSNGSSPANRTVTADYNILNRFRVLRTSFLNKDWILFIAAATTIINMLLDPLAGSVFIVRTLPREMDKPPEISITKSLGLDTTFNDYSAFVAAAGFAQAAVFHRLPDPPFVKDNFTVPEFEFPKERYLNGTLVLTTPAIETSLNCFLPDAGSVVGRATDSSLTQARIEAKWSGCTINTTFNISSTLGRISQYGVVSAWPCIPPSSVVNYHQTDHRNEVETNRLLHPVMWWFWKPPSLSGEGQTYDPDRAVTRVVFCAPTIRVHEVEARANLTTLSLEKVDVKRDWQWGSTGGPRTDNLAVQGAFNGVLFNPNSNPFIQARATTVTAGLPETIFKLATQDMNPDQAFADENTLLNATVKVYNQHLSIVAKGVYFTNERRNIRPTLIAMETRLWVDPAAAHSLAILLFSSATLIALTFFWYFRESRRLRLPQQPGSIAYTAAIVNPNAPAGGPNAPKLEGGTPIHTGTTVPGLEWTTQLSPLDDERMMEAKLRGLLFGLDGQGRVIAHGMASGGHPYLAPSSGAGNYPFAYGYGSGNDRGMGGPGGGVIYDGGSHSPGEEIPPPSPGGIPLQSQPPRNFPPDISPIPSPSPTPAPEAAVTHGQGGGYAPVSVSGITSPPADGSFGYGPR